MPRGSSDPRYDPERRFAELERRMGTYERSTHRSLAFSDGTRIRARVGLLSTGGWGFEQYDAAGVRSPVGFAPAARVKHSVNQTIASGSTWVLLSWDQEDFDNDAIHDTATLNSRLVCKTAGLYLPILQAGYAINAAGDRGGMIRKNSAGDGTLGTEVARTTVHASASFRTQVTPSGPVELAGNDYLEAFGIQNSGGDLALEAAFSHFSMVRQG